MITAHEALNLTLEANIAQRHEAMKQVDQALEAINGVITYAANQGENKTIIYPYGILCACNNINKQMYLHILQETLANYGYKYKYYAMDEKLLISW